jgi:hypothetical protein
MPKTQIVLEQTIILLPIYDVVKNEERLCCRVPIAIFCFTLLNFGAIDVTSLLVEEETLCSNTLYGFRTYKNVIMLSGDAQKQDQS